MRSFLGWLLRGLDGLRRVLHLLLLLAIFGFVVGVLRTSIPRLPDKAALVIHPEGEIVEQRAGDPLQRAVAEVRGIGNDETLLRDLVDVIEAAKGDERIQALVLDFDTMSGAGQPTLDEFARAVTDFRQSGKKVIARGTGFTRDTYYVAAHADEIYVDPLGFVLLEGYDRYRMYFKEAFDKLGIDVNVFRVGTYKSAVEPYVRQNMSKEDREESVTYLGSLWDTYLAAVAAARGLEPEALRERIAASRTTSRRPPAMPPRWRWTRSSSPASSRCWTSNSDSPSWWARTRTPAPTGRSVSATTCGWCMPSRNCASGPTSASA